MHNFRTNSMEWLNGVHGRNSGRRGIAGMERSSGWTWTTCVACLTLGGVQWSEKKMENDVSRSWPEVQKNRICFMRKIRFLLHFFTQTYTIQLSGLFMLMFQHERKKSEWCWRSHSFASPYSRLPRTAGRVEMMRPFVRVVQFRIRSSLLKISSVCMRCPTQSDSNKTSQVNLAKYSTIKRGQNSKPWEVT